MILAVSNITQPFESVNSTVYTPGDKLFKSSVVSLLLHKKE